MCHVEQGVWRLWRGGSWPARIAKENFRAQPRVYRQHAVATAVGQCGVAVGQIIGPPRQKIAALPESKRNFCENRAARRRLGNSRNAWTDHSHSRPNRIRSAVAEKAFAGGGNSSTVCEIS